MKPTIEEKKAEALERKKLMKTLYSRFQKLDYQRRSKNLAETRKNGKE
jgi:hypothetical protein